MIKEIDLRALINNNLKSEEHDVSPVSLGLDETINLKERTFEKDSYYAGSFPYKIGKWFFRKKRWVCDFTAGWIAGSGWEWGVERADEGYYRISDDGLLLEKV